MATNVFSLPHLFLKMSQSAPDMVIRSRSAAASDCEPAPWHELETGHAAVNNRTAQNILLYKLHDFPQVQSRYHGDGRRENCLTFLENFAIVAKELN